LNSDLGPNQDYAFRTYVSASPQSDVDGDGVGDACDLCAAGPGSGDTNADGAFDLRDYRRMAPCVLGVGRAVPSGCECFDFDGDGDVDLKDVRDLSRGFQPTPGCLIDGVVHYPGESDAPPFDCRRCEPRQNRRGWTVAGAGDNCSTGYCDGNRSECCNIFCVDPVTRAPQCGAQVDNGCGVAVGEAQHYVKKQQ